MNQYMQYAHGIMHSERYSDNYEDDDDFDECEDGYDGLTDYDEEDESIRPFSRRGASVDCGGPVGSDYRRQRTGSESSATQLDIGDDNRRDHHNQLERKRRASIKTSYNELREAIPSLRNSKASRAIILQRADEYIEEQIMLKRGQIIHVDNLRRDNDVLECEVKALQRRFQSVENEGAAAASINTTGSVSLPAGPSTSGGTSSSATGGCTTRLRLVSGPLSSSVGGTAVNTSGLPTYRLLKQPQESSEGVRSTMMLASHAGTSHSVTAQSLSSTRSLPNNTTVVSGGTHNVQLLPRSLGNPASLHFTMAATSSNSPHSHTAPICTSAGAGLGYTVRSNLSTLSAAASLVANTPSGILLDTVQSGSQRSSPCGPLSSSSSSSSSTGQTSLNSSTPTATAGNTGNTGDDEEEDEGEGALVIETFGTRTGQSQLSEEAAVGTSRRSLAGKPPTVVSITSASQPPVLLTRAAVRSVSLAPGTTPINISRITNISGAPVRPESIARVKTVVRSNRDRTESFPPAPTSSSRLEILKRRRFN